MLTDREKEIIRRWDEFVARMPPGLKSMRDGLEDFSKELNADLPEVGAFHERVELRPGLRADVSVPKGNAPFPVVVYLHGGGWVAGSLATHRKLGMQFADAGYLCINVDYRLAPENAFPAGLDDCIFAIKWTAENSSRFGGDPSRIAVGGDSAGGNLAAASLVSLANDPVRRSLRAGILIYGVFDFAGAVKRGGTSSPIEGMARAYLGAQYPAALDDPRVSPLGAVKPGALPPCFIIVGEKDFLLGDSKTLADAMKRADIDHELHVIDEMPHAFMQMSELSGCRRGQELMFNFLRRRMR
jgi:acetyl esterase